jgi:hypothetical protein
MPRLEDIEAAIKRERAKTEADRAKEASQSEARQRSDEAWERVTQCYQQDIARELGRDVSRAEFYAGWARRFVELGKRLVEVCWDWRLNELRSESLRL